MSLPERPSDVTREALEQLADIVMERETGVRALRSLFEDLLLELRYEMPSKRKAERFLITKDIVRERLSVESRLKGPKPKRETA